MLEAIFPDGIDEIDVPGLTQWDTGQKLQISLAELPATFQVHFAHYKKASVAYVVEATAKNGVAEVSIPNLILQKESNAVAWVYIVNDDERETIKTINLPIQYRARPADYVYEEDEILYFEKVQNQMAAMLDEAKESASQANEYLNGMPNLIDKHNTDAEAHADMRQAISERANALKGNASGEVVRVNDVSPVEHKARAKVSGKNLFNIDEGLNGVLVKNDDGTYTITRGTNRFSEYILMPISANTTITISCVGMLADGFRALTILLRFTDNTTAYVNMTNEVSVYTRTFDKDIRDAQIYLLPDAIVGDYKTFSGIQVEYGDTATEYEPYIDPSSVTVTRCGKNLFDISKVHSDKYINNNDDGTLTVTTIPTSTASQIQGVTLADLAPELKVGETYTLSANSTGTDKYIYLSGANKMWTFGDASIMTEEKLNSAVNLYASGVSTTAVISNIQIEKGDTATDYEPYTAETYTPDTDGNCEITSLAPTMTLLTDTAGVTIDLEYNKDINAENEAVRADITELDRITGEHTNLLGDVETALDNIIAMQNALIGGEA